jgi:hypothetical protein
MLGAARRGVAIPGDPSGSVSPREHNDGIGLERSPYTSWSRSIEEAHRHGADLGGGYVILRLDENDMDVSAGWSWEASPDTFKEEEVLLKGVRIDCEVIFP